MMDNGCGVYSTVVSSWMWDVRLNEDVGWIGQVSVESGKRELVKFEPDREREEARGGLGKVKSERK